MTSIRSASGKNTLILEGEPDRRVYQIWLGKLAGSEIAAFSKVDLVSLGGKNEVLIALAWFRDHGDNPVRLGLAGLDEWGRVDDLISEQTICLDVRSQDNRCEIRDS